MSTITKGDMYLKDTIRRIFAEGCMDKNPPS